MNTVVLITGASRGIGAATALQAARAGYTVAVNYRANALAAENVVRQIRDMGGRATAVLADVADEEQVLAMFATIDTWGISLAPIGTKSQTRYSRWPQKSPQSVMARRYVIVLNKRVLT